MPHTCMQPCTHGRMGTDDGRLICGVPTIKQRNRALGRTAKTVIADDAQCRSLHVHARQLRLGHNALINIIYNSSIRGIGEVPIKQRYPFMHSCRVVIIHTSNIINCYFMFMNRMMMFNVLSVSCVCP